VMTLRRVVVVLLAPVVLMVATAPGAAADGSNVTTAPAVSGFWKPTSFKLGWKIESAEGSLSTVSLASANGWMCGGCRSLGVAVGITLLGDPQVINQYAQAVTTTFHCVACTTVADAHTFVLASSQGTPHLTQDGHNRLVSVQQQLRALGASALHAEALRASIDPIIERIAAILLDPSSYYVDLSTSEIHNASSAGSAYLVRRDASSSSTEPNDQEVATDHG
jgi:hypothetical protein